MRDFILRKDLWTLDYFSALLFGLGVAYLTRTAGRIIYDATWDRILFEMFLALVGYSAAFAIALWLRNKIKFLRSWAWMGLLGPMGYLVLGQLVYFYPRNWEYFKLISDTTSAAIKNAFLGVSESVVAAWLILTPFACLCIFAMRFIVYMLIDKSSPNRSAPVVY